MQVWRKMVLGLGLLLGVIVLAGAGGAQDKKKDDKGDKGDNKGRPGFQIGQGRDLVSKELQEKLKLSDTQKEKITKLNTEYSDKVKPLVAKLKDSGKDGFREVFQDMQKVRGEFNDKVKTVLNDEQKKTFEEASRNRFGQGGQPGQRPGQGQGQGRRDASIFSRDVQDQLGLSAEQKEKLEKIKKELDEKSLEVLNGDQKKKLEDIKKGGQNPPTTGRRPQTKQGTN